MFTNLVIEVFLSKTRKKDFLTIKKLKMKKIFIIVALFTCIVNLKAQVVYTANDYGVIGDVFQQKMERLEDGNQIPIDEIDAQMWNLSTLLATDTKDIRILSVSEFDELSSFPDDCMLIETITGSYQIVKLVDNVLYQYGIYALVNDQYTPLIFTDSVPVLSFPLTIGETETSDFTFETLGEPEDFGVNESALDSMLFVTSIVMTSEVIGDGELLTPTGTYMALKILSTLQMNIDVWVKPPIGAWFLYQPTMVDEASKELQYYAVDYGIPVAKVRMNWDEEVTDYVYLNNQENAIVNEDINPLNCYPNPARSVGQIHFEEPVKQIELYDLGGRKVFASNVNASMVMLPELPAGSYIVRIPENQKHFTLIIDN